MGRKLDLFLGRKFKIPKFTATVNLAVSRVAVLKKQRQARLNVSRSDIVELLKLNHHEVALTRVDQVIKEQNMLDVFVMVDGYCHLLLQMVNLIEKEKDCPDELKEAVSSLLYAAPRCGEFPELQEVRTILTARYGKGFVHDATELRSSSRVNRKMMQKLSQQPPSFETRTKILQEIATDIGVVLNLENPSPSPKQDNNSIASNNDIEPSSYSSESRTGKKKYKGVEDAAQAAFESAANAAEAARAAVELSRSRSNRSFGSDHPRSPNSRPRKAFHNSDTEKSIIRNGKMELGLEGESSNKNTGFDESDDEIVEIEDEIGGISSSKDELGFDYAKSESGVDKGKKMEIDLTKRPMSVRNKRVYGR